MKTNTGEYIQYLIVKGMIAELPLQDRKKIESCANKLRETIKEAGTYGNIALALVGSEATAEAQ